MIRTLTRLLAGALLAGFAVPGQAEDLNENGIREAIESAGFEGDIAISTRLSGPPRYRQHGLLPQPYRGDGDGLTWRWASVTKQIIAILVMRQVEAGTLSLDDTAQRHLPKFASKNAGTVTIKQLLQHRSGLPNPDDSVTDQGEPFAFYRPDFTGSRDPVTGFCAGPVKAQPGGQWSYNNCDYMVLGAVLEAVTGLDWQSLFNRDIAAPLGLELTGAYPGEPFTRWGFIGEADEPRLDMAVFGASAGLYESPDDLLAIDNALMRGDLLSENSLNTMWDGDPALGFMALGQWVFKAPLEGCKEPVRIVERRGGIGAVQVRNFILPEKEMAIAAFSQRLPFDFGEVWVGEGFSYDLLSASACPDIAEL